MEKRPLPVDEKTRVIPQGVVNNAARPAQPLGGPPPQAQASAAVPPPRPPFGSTLQNQEKGAVEKRRILPGLLIGGGLLAGGLALTSFMSSPSEEEALPAADALGAVSGGGIGGTVPAVVSTSLPVSELVADDLSFEEARDLARTEVGERGLFTYQGGVHTTMTDTEMEALTPEQREAFMRDVTVAPNTVSGTEVDVDGKIMEVKFPLMERHTEILVDEDGHAYSRDHTGQVNLLDNVTEDPITGELHRTDPETGEITQFNPTAILQNVDEGKIDISIYPSDVEVTNDGELLFTGEPLEPIGASSYVTNYNDDGTWTAGWDYDGDGMVDSPVENSWDLTAEEPSLPAEPISEVETPKSEAELLNDRIKEIAEDAGIDDIRKIKVHESGDGFDIKIKGEDGEKIKMHLSKDDLTTTDNHQSEDNTRSTADLSTDHNTHLDHGIDQGNGGQWDTTLDPSQDYDNHHYH